MCFYGFNLFYQVETILLMYHPNVVVELKLLESDKIIFFDSQENKLNNILGEKNVDFKIRNLNFKESDFD